ncbi:MAG: alpha-2-macroglobulin, partial [Ideonella sp.]
FEAQPVTGSSRFSLGAARVSQDWAAPAAAPLNLPWPADAGNATLLAEHSGSGKPWLTVQTLAAVPLTAPLEAGYSLQRSITPVTQKVAGRWSRGDVLRVKLSIDARASMSWVAISDPLPAGATVLGSGLGRDSQIAVASEAAPRAGTAPAYIERATEAWRAIYDWLPKGQHTVEYTVRLNSSGRFQLPTSRIEAMYAPASFAERPNAPLDVQP